jgi:hypothetical protein
MSELSDEELLKIYEWVDSIPLSREKKNITRDFSDGVLCAEIIKHYHPKLVDLHNYPSSLSSKQKKVNWNTLCLKVFHKIKYDLSRKLLEDIVSCKPKAIEKVLMDLYNILEAKKKVTKTEEKSRQLTQDEESIIKMKKDQIKELQNNRIQLNEKLNEINSYNNGLQNNINNLNTRKEYSKYVK